MLAKAISLKLSSRGRLSPVYWFWVRSCSWSSKDVRSKFIRHFEDQGHRNFPSSSVVPKKGDGTYFTNAGMNQFKPLFLGQCDPMSKLSGLTRAVNSQKCIRVGGKHNDLEDVGLDLTHHTFFEMLGSWSFGDYFKQEACAMAYGLLTTTYGLPTDRLYFTYFGGDRTLSLPADDECRDLWASLGIPRERILPFGVKDNFWDMGVTGPCGPCTEIHYDHVGGGRFAGSEVNSGSPNVVEIWNLVFMQYNRQADQSLQPLPTHHVDTGMGLERMVAVLNGTNDNYATDLFTPLFDLIQQVTGVQPYRGQLTTEDTAYRMLADHSRMLTIAISDGLLPSNDNLGHKVRVILHKCIQLCRRHFNSDPRTLLPALTQAVVSSLEGTYPELIPNQTKVVAVLESAIGHHDHSLHQATRSFHKMMTRLAPATSLSGGVIAALERGHFGHAMPLDVITDLARLEGLEVDMDDYHLHQHQLQQHQQVQALADKAGAESNLTPPVTQGVSTPALHHDLIDLFIADGRPTTEDGYKYHYASNEGTCDLSTMAARTSPCSVQGMLGCDGQITPTLKEGQSGEIILDKTCFYAEAGGQEGDRGLLQTETGVFQVDDVQTHRGYVVHSGHMTHGCLSIGQSVTPEVSVACRQGNMRNHTGTHMLNAALQAVLPSTQQEGSSVTSRRFTFDFLALSKLDVGDLEVIESKVREVIMGGHPVSCQEMSLSEAEANPAVRRIQNEDYPEEVRLVTIGSSTPGHPAVSMELCGGTHVVNTAELSGFCVTGLTSKSQHVQRVTCVTGPQALQACEIGRLAEAMCSLLRLLHAFVDGRDNNITNNTPPAATVMKAAQALETQAARVQTILEEATVTPSDSVDCTQEDGAKTTGVLHSLCDDLRPLQTTSPSHAACVKVMKMLIGRIHQCEHLELLPRTVRHETQTCLRDMEHRVQTLVNTDRTADLKTALTRVELEGDNSELAFITVDSDINPRQIVKVANQKAVAKPVVLIQDGGKSVWNVIVNLPMDPNKPRRVTGEGLLTGLVEAVGRVAGSAKGKEVTSHKKGTQPVSLVWRVTVKGGNNGNLDKNRLQAELLHWWTKNEL